MPSARGLQKADFGLMKVQVPQAMNMRDLKSAHLTALESLNGP
jgi:2-C-methyl-D-erythritol 4-phosphate cytidylyltransferase